MSNPVTFAERLLAWWDDHGRKDLPWQHPRTPYRVWVSEVMLQQTQVATVIPYFERWMERLPDLPALASAEQDEVLALWSGLGYYARARNLHKAAITCVDHHGGELPDCPALLASLPGIGLSTANAIVSQAHDQPLAILDGNAKRVLARHAGLDGWPGQARVLRRFWQESNDRLPRQRGADYTQAIMDLGAMVCTRSKPGCGACPVATDCVALQENRVERYPVSKPRTVVREQEIHMLVLQRGDGAILLERRPPSGIWGGLWSLPDSDSALELATRFGLDQADLKQLPSIEHRLTHRRLIIRPVSFEGAPAQTIAEGEQKWCEPAGWGALGVPKPVRGLLRALAPAQG